MIWGVIKKTVDCWVRLSNRFVGSNQYSREICCLYLQGRRLRRRFLQKPTKLYHNPDDYSLKVHLAGKCTLTVHALLHTNKNKSTVYVYIYMCVCVCVCVCVYTLHTCKNTSVLVVWYLLGYHIQCYHSYCSKSATVHLIGIYVKFNARKCLGVHTHVHAHFILCNSAWTEQDWEV